MADAIILTISTAPAPFTLTTATSPTVSLQLGASLVGGFDLTGPSSIKGISSFISGIPEASEIVIASLAPYSYTINGADSGAVSLENASLDAVYTIKKTVSNVTTVIGTITFLAGTNTGVIDITDADVPKSALITVQAPSVQDATLGDIAFLLAE